MDDADEVFEDALEAFGEEEAVTINNNKPSKKITKYV